MATLKEFEDALRRHGQKTALAILEALRERDRAKRTTAAPARRIAGRKMTPELARRIVELHASTPMTQQEIAFQLGVNQGRVNEVLKRGKWLDAGPDSPEVRARDAAVARMSKRKRAGTGLGEAATRTSARPSLRSPGVRAAQLTFL